MLEAPPPRHDVLVVAGDVSENPQLSVEIVAALTAAPVIMVLGNHECSNSASRTIMVAIMRPTEVDRSKVMPFRPGRM